MAILVEGFSIIAKLHAIDERYAGGVLRYQQETPNRTYRDDGYLCGVGFMNPNDRDEFVKEIEKAGLIVQKDGEFADAALVNHEVGLFEPCHWLVLERDKNNHMWASLKGANKTEKIAYKGFSGSEMYLISKKDIISKTLVSEKRWWQYWK